MLAFEYPNPFPPQESTIFFQLAGNKIANNTFVENGKAAGKYAGDVLMQGGLFGEEASTNNCLLGNSFTAATWPPAIETTWGCQNSTPNPNEGGETLEFLLEFQAVSEGRTPEPQPAPPAQPTMPNPCEGVPANPLCEPVAAAKRG